MSVEKVDLSEGKYTVILNDMPHEFKALRYGEEWRDLTGDGMILSMFFKILELQAEVEKLKRRG
jgi:hypothetical protein